MAKHERLSTKLSTIWQIIDYLSKKIDYQHPWPPSNIIFQHHLKKIVCANMRVDRSWDDRAAACSEQHIHIAGVRDKSENLELRKYSPCGNIESVAAPAKKSMKAKAD